MNYNIPFIKPSFPGSGILMNDYADITRNNWYTNYGPFEREFSNKLENFLDNGAKIITFSNATLALMACINELIGHGDGSQYIIMPSFTFVAGAQAILWCGYKPYFIDINEETLQMNIDAAKSIVGKGAGIKGVLFCNAFGVGDSNIEDWEDFAESLSIPLIIDSAAGFGSKYIDGEYLGARGDCEVFSFHATKPFAVGEGGAVSSRNKQLIDKLKTIQNFGFNNSRDSQALGFNAKMQEFNAAIGIRQLERFKGRLQQRQSVLKKYKAGLKSLTFQQNAEISSVCFASAIVPKSVNRNKLVEELNSIGIQIREYYNPPIHKQVYFMRNKHLSKSQRLNITNDISEKIISLPVHDDMNSAHIDAIIDEILSRL